MAKQRLGDALAEEEYDILLYENREKYVQDIFNKSHIHIFLVIFTPNKVHLILNKNQELSPAYRVSCETNKEQQQ